VSVQEPIDNPTGWVNRHIRSYVESGGKRGHRWQGADTLLLITRGRKSGELRRTALIYGRDGDRFVVVGSNGGSSTHPAWYLNLVADPDVTVQVGEEVLEARARDATPDERPRLWELMTGIWPDYDNYQRRTDRQIPVVVIERR
jgi:deazaflavin-dependent oxidoreductase (nitroreductase family)